VNACTFDGFSMSEVRTLEDFLEAVRARPGMFTVDFDLDRIETMLHGYSAALHAHEITEMGRDFNRHFADFVHEGLGWSTSRGWADAITTNCVSPEAAFQRFFLLFDEFRRARRAGAI
jgi:hypothetical protein